MDIAIQLYTVRDRTATDMVGTLEALAEIGYTQIEPAGYGNSTPTEMRARSTGPGCRQFPRMCPWTGCSRSAPP